jgi:Protein kinase domain
MGEVYRARDTRFQRDVALKVLHGADDLPISALQRFQGEARITALLNHPGIVQIQGQGIAGGAPYLALELVGGESLQALLERDGPREPREAVRLALALARAMDHAHEQGILHRDLKPDNVLIDRSGEPRIVDFGLGKLVGDLQSRRLTRTGQVIGTPAYAPPEQISGDLDKIGPRADVYGLGAILFALLTGKPPFQGTTAINVLKSVLTDPAPAPSERRPGVDATLDQICRQCLAKAPEDRYQTAASLAEDLADYLAPAFQPTRRSGLLPLVVAGLLGVNLLVVLIVVGLRLLPEDAPLASTPPSPVSEQPRDLAPVPPSPGPHQEPPVATTPPEVADEWEPVWRQADPVSGPGGRWGHRLAYHPGRGRVVLHGGQEGQRLLSDSWEWDGERWVEASGQGAPATSGHAFAYDMQHQRLLLWGGRTAETEPRGSPLLRLTPAGWEEHQSPGEAALTPFFGACYDETGQRLVVCGTTGDSRRVGGATWAWSEETGWSALGEESKPLHGAALVFDTQSQRVLRLGGSAKSQRQRGLWELNEDRWVELETQGGPSPRAHHAMAWAEDRLVVFGGTDRAPRGDTWFWRAGRWTLYEAETSPSARLFGSMAFDRRRGQLVLFGGRRSGDLGDTWVMQIRRPE